jgi:hypothetical protein
MKPGDLDLFAPLAHVEFLKHLGGELAGIGFAGLGDGHQRAGLVVAELRVGTRADKDGGEIGVRQDGGHGGLQLGFKLVMKHARISGRATGKVEQKEGGRTKFQGQRAK